MITIANAKINIAQCPCFNHQPNNHFIFQWKLLAICNHLLSMLRFSSACEASVCATSGEKKDPITCQTTEAWRHKRSNFRQICTPNRRYDSLEEVPLTGMGVALVIWARVTDWRCPQALSGKHGRTERCCCIYGHNAGWIFQHDISICQKWTWNKLVMLPSGCVRKFRTMRTLNYKNRPSRK